MDCPATSGQARVVSDDHAGLKRAMEDEAIGKLLSDEPKEDDTPDGVYELTIEVNDQDRARKLIEQVLMSVDDPTKSFADPDIEVS
jgi:hypothetical protein